MEKPQLSNSIYYEIIQKCNLKCKHCSDLFEEKTKYLDKNQIISFHKSIVKYGITASIVTGGEPTLHPNYGFIVQELSKLGTVVVTTNGTHFDINKHIEILKKHPNIILQISLDGITKNTFDKIRGKGTYLKVMNLLNSLLEEKLHKQIAFSMTLMNYNIHELKDMIDFARSKNILYLYFPTLLPIGFANDIWKDISIDINTQIEVENLLLEATSDTHWSTKISSNRINDILSRTLHENDADCLNIFTLKINPNGEILPCPISSNSSFAMGNIKDKDIASNLITKLKKKREVYLSLNNTPSKCFNCNVFNKCSSRFCENCSLFINPPNKNFFEHTCEISYYHFSNIMKEMNE